jgi:hypothetical protein
MFLMKGYFLKIPKNSIIDNIHLKNFKITGFYNEITFYEHEIDSGNFHLVNQISTVNI